MLDTNILSDLVKHPSGVVAAKIAEVGSSAVCTSIIVACELRFGAAKKSAPILTQKVDALLKAIRVLPLEQDADTAYGEIRDRLEKAGTPIGANDMLIASHALSQNLVLVTDNVGEFSRIASLRVENWLRDSVANLLTGLSDQ
ncbi:MAG TPA: type II toxin-antitoxin system VapC family toxin [Gallionella sp.]|nr:type II toxin-antitoxin system VapC family toxin [Gallionella sp.]